ncbi:unnamed protein product [Pedinophyceae sp. YPF-701]|nr:unnamed protein product [Pedinophyceae sp. YPF-701]
MTGRARDHHSQGIALDRSRTNCKGPARGAATWTEPRRERAPRSSPARSKSEGHQRTMYVDVQSFALGAAAVGAVAVVRAVRRNFLWSWHDPAPCVPELGDGGVVGADEDPGVVTVYGGGRLGEAHFSVSWAVSRVCCFLELAGLEKRCVEALPDKGPKHKMPWIEHRGRTVTDSGFIIRYLRKVLPHHRGVQALFECEARDPRRWACAAAAARLCNESLYFFELHQRWVRPGPGAWDVTKSLFAGVPGPIRPLISTMVRNDLKESMYRVGTARFSQTDIAAEVEEIIATLEGLLGGEEFFGGDTPCAHDCMTYSALEQYFHAPWYSPQTTPAVLRSKRLAAYVARVRALVPPEKCAARFARMHVPEAAKYRGA